MERRVLIVESQNDFALTMASVLKNAGYHTSLAGSAADAQRELEKRRPDLVVLRAELPDQSGFVLCGNIRKGRFGNNLPVILVSSDVAAEALQQHSQSPNAANGYLAIPFEMGELARLTQTIVPHQGPSATHPDSDDVDRDLDSALTGSGPRTDEIPAVPPPLKAAPAGGPPRLPKRERRSALTDDDKAFLDRAFASIADRKAELLAESREVRRAPRREMLGTPEAKIQILRDELKVREAQIARISEIYAVRERELLSVEDRLNEKDVEIQSNKLQIDDLGRRLNDAQNTLVEKEREHGRQVEDLLLQKFIGEKEVIEVVSAKEKDINMLRREITGKDEELARRSVELDQARKDYEALEKDFSLATLEFEVKEKQLTEAGQQKDAAIGKLKGELEQAAALQATTLSERDAKFADYEGQLKALTETLDKNQAERDGTVHDLESKLRLAEEHAQRSDTEIDRLHAELADVRTRTSERIGDLEGEAAGLKANLEALGQDKQESDQAFTEKVNERDARIAQLEGELADTVERKDRQEAELQAQIQEKLERIGELEGEVEAAKAALADREAELTAEVGELGAQLGEAQAANQAHTAKIAGLEQTLAARQATIDALNAEVADKNAKGAQLEALLGEARQAIKQLQQGVAERDGSIQALQGTLAERDAEVQRLSVSLDETQKALLSTQQTLNDTEANLEQRNAELGGTRDTLAQTQGELEKVRGERDERNGQLVAARNEIQRITELFRTSETTKAQLEEQLSADLGTVRSQLSEAQGNYEAEAAAHQQLQQETSDVIARLTAERNELVKRLEATGVDLAATRANLEDTSKALHAEKKAHADHSKSAQEAIATLELDLSNTREQAQDLSEQLAATKQELGARVAELTQLNAKFAHAEDTRHHLEERLSTHSNEAQRREELLQNDLAAKSKELSDTLRKLTTLQQEKTRQTDALTREVTARTEQAKQLESKLKSLFDESKKKVDDLSHRLQAANAELEAAKKDIAEKSEGLQRAGEAQAAALGERDQVRGQMQAQLQQVQARLQETTNALTHERAVAKKAADENAAKVQRAEARIAQVQQEAKGHTGEMENRLKESQSQLALRQRRIAELEQALEGASSTRARVEKDLTQKIQASEQKANDAAARLAAAMQERKALDAKHLKDVEDVHARQKQELERRDQVKAQEVKRLQEAVQEKSKQLKVVELELARYKNKPAGAGTAARPAVASTTAPAARSPLAAAVEEEATKVNTIPDAAKPPSQRAPTGQHARVPPPAQAGRAPAVAITAAQAQKQHAGEDRTVVVPTGQAPKKPAAAGDDETDFTSIIDNLGD